MQRKKSDYMSLLLRYASQKMDDKFKFCHKLKKKATIVKTMVAFLVGVTRLELAAPRPPV